MSGRWKQGTAWGWSNRQEPCPPFAEATQGTRAGVRPGERRSECACKHGCRTAASSPGQPPDPSSRSPERDPNRNAREPWAINGPTAGPRHPGDEPRSPPNDRPAIRLPTISAQLKQQSKNASHDVRHHQQIRSLSGSTIACCSLVCSQDCLPGHSSAERPPKFEATLSNARRHCKQGISRRTARRAAPQSS